jgi:hypothetical protein
MNCLRNLLPKGKNRIIWLFAHDLHLRFWQTFVQESLLLGTNKFSETNLQLFLSNFLCIGGLSPVNITRQNWCSRAYGVCRQGFVESGSKAIKEFLKPKVDIVDFTVISELHSKTR